MGFSAISQSILASSLTTGNSLINSCPLSELAIRAEIPRSPLYSGLNFQIPQKSPNVMSDVL
jgi:hypothetical protein